MIHVVATHEAAEGRAAALRAALGRLVSPSRAEEGCVQYDLHEDRAQPGYFVFYEIWRDQASFDAHASSAHLKAFAREAPELTKGGEVRLLDRLA